MSSIGVFILSAGLATLSSASARAIRERLDPRARARRAAEKSHLAPVAQISPGAIVKVVGRITFDYKLVPTPPTELLTRRDAANYKVYVDYYRAHHVRVVNMSWGGSPAGLESALEKNNIGKDATERKAMAARLFAIDRAGLYNAIKSAPEILFVCAAGNGDSDGGLGFERGEGLHGRREGRRVDQR